MSQQQHDLDLYFDQKLDELANSIVAQLGFVFRGVPRKFKAILKGKLRRFNPNKLKLIPYMCFYDRHITLVAHMQYNSGDMIRIKVKDRTVKKEKVKMLLNGILATVKNEINKQ